jgi:hypothetical protein
MSRFPLRAPEHFWPGRRPREVARYVKRLEAEDRNARTPHERTRAHRERRCDCLPAVVEPSPKKSRQKKAKEREVSRHV